VSIEETLKQYHDFCVVNRGMQPRVAKDYREYAARFLKSSKGVSARYCEFGVVRNWASTVFQIDMSMCVRNVHLSR